MLEEIEKFKKKLSPPDNRGCINWVGAKTTAGYGTFNHGGRKVKNRTKYAHRFSYEFYNGELKKGFYVCHKCDNPACVNPEHLFLASPKDNNNDMIKKKRIQHGSNHWKSKLTEKEVVRIRKMIKINIKQTIIAEKFNISPNHVSCIKTKKLWSYLT